MSNTKSASQSIRVYFNDNVIDCYSAPDLSSKGFRFNFCRTGFEVVADINLKTEVFFKDIGDDIYLYDNKAYIELKQSRSDDRINNSKFFESNYTFPVGETAFSDIRRIIPGRKYFWSADGLTQQPITMDSFKDFGRVVALEEQLAKQMLSAIESSRKYTKELNSKDICVLFSGGIDSILLVQSLLSKGIEPILITAVAKDPFDSSAIDEYRSAVLAKYWGLEHYEAVVDLDEAAVMECWGKLKNDIPMAVHTGIFFERAFQKAKDLGVKVIFAGQNADTFYNLGPTSKISLSISDLADTFRRFFLSDYIINSLAKKNEVRTIVSKLKYAPAKLAMILGVLVLNLMMRNKKVFVPTNVDQAVVAYKSRPDYIIFPSSEDILSATESRCESGFFDEIYGYKVENFLMTGAPQVIYSYGEKYDIEVVMPYSSKEIIGYFHGMKKSVLNVFFPKKEIYDASKRLDRILPKFAGASGASLKYPSYHEWLLKHWGFLNSSEDNKPFGNASSFMIELSKFWLK